MITNLLGETLPENPIEILAHAPALPYSPQSVFLLLSGGNDSRVMAHVVKPWFEKSPYKLELAAVDTQLAMDGWADSIREFAEWIGLPVSFWKGEGQEYYTEYVRNFGFPGNVAHAQIQNRLKGRAFRKMVQSRQVCRKRGRKPKNAPQVERQAVWLLSGIRKSESKKREKLTSPYSWRENGLFINPLFYWSKTDVLNYIESHNIPPAPGKQWDCRCGSTTSNAASEWAEIRRKSPRLYAYLSELAAVSPWTWGCFDKSVLRHLPVHTGLSNLPRMVNGDDGSLESFPVCVNCWRDLDAEDEQALNDWG